MEKPLIGILGDTTMTEPGLFTSRERAYVNSAYVDAVFLNGGLPVLIAPSVLSGDTEGILSRCDGILVPGGEDVDPAYYGEDPAPEIGVFRPELDESWFKACRYALDHKIPMMGVCRGTQVLNVLLGGSLYQDIDLRSEGHIQHLQKYERWYLTHEVTIKEGSRLEKILGPGTCKTNSMHHQAIKALGKGLTVTAVAHDGIIEAIEDEEGLIVAVQWHPEELIHSAPIMNQLFADLVQRSSHKG